MSSSTIPLVGARLLIALGATLISAHAPAATTCVSSVAQLRAALSAAETNQEDDTIQVVATALTYNFGAPLIVNVQDSHSLTIEGGYAFGCATPPQAIPANTVLNGVASSGAYIRLVGNGGLTIRNFSLTGFLPAAGTDAIYMQDTSSDGMIRIENVAVQTNAVAGAQDTILGIYPGGGLIFDDNIVDDNGPSGSSVSVFSELPNGPITIANNTIANNSGPGLTVIVGSELPTGIYNNILWHNAANDLVIVDADPSTPPIALNNTWLNCSGCGELAYSSANNQSADPLLTPSFRLDTHSPAINTGVPLPVLFPFTANDAAGNQRVVGSAPDQGAYETSVEDQAIRVVTSRADSGPNTLRQAILDANASGNPSQITFDLGSTCPQTIELNSSLPSPVVSLAIDGYFEFGTALNSTSFNSQGQLPFNGTICVILSGQSNFYPALNLTAATPTNVHVDVSSLGFKNFAIGVELSGGAGSQIHGDVFALESGLIGVVGNGIGVQLDGGAADVIGGPLPSDVNLIGASTGYGGVFVISNGSATSKNNFHTITNNSIGGDPSAQHPDYGNALSGIALDGVSQITITQNQIVANGAAGIELGNASYCLIQGNHIGLYALGNGAAGVDLYAGSALNWIGTTSPLGVANSNQIESNGGAGVQVNTTAGTNNEVTGNSFYADNGGLAIDLAAPGPTLNAGDETTGPNHLLHKPVLSSVVYASANTMIVKGAIQTEAPNTYRYVSLYANETCGGGAQSPLGTYLEESGIDGIIHLNFIVPTPAFPTLFSYINATSEAYTGGAADTSEISNSKALSPFDDIFNDEFCY